MKICPKCQAEFSDDISACSCCGTPLQLKPQESICPGCGEAQTISCCIRKTLTTRNRQRLKTLFCNEAKRFHDLNRANIWAVIFMVVPILICALSPLYGFIVMAIIHIYPLFFKGTKGPNRFGDEP